MRKPQHREVHSRDAARPIAAMIALCLWPALANLVVAGESVDERTVVKRPIVVVRDQGAPSFYAWSSIGSRSFLGVQTVDMTSELRQHFGVPDDAGVLVSKIVEDSPATAAGIEVGDILTRFADQAIDSPVALAHAVGSQESGATVELELWRNGRSMTLTATLTERDWPWVDIRRLRPPGPGQIEVFSWSEDDLEGAIELQGETIQRAIERLNEELDSPEWHERLHRFQRHQGDLKQRIEELEQRLRELEDELEALPDRD